MEYVLIVEDSTTEGTIFAEYISQIGIDILIAKSGEEALEKIRESRPKFILLDILLPGRSGFEICRELKKGENTNTIPIVLCSTKDTKMDKFWGKKQGADAYLSKPIDPDELIRVVREFIV